MVLANTSLTIDPAWPWSAPGVGLPVFASVALALVVLTLWTYRGVQGVTARRVLGVLLLRLAALRIACLLILRPSLAHQDDAVVPSKLLIVLVFSESMNINDEFNNLSRWDSARRILRSAAVESLLKRLQNEQKVEL